MQQERNRGYDFSEKSIGKVVKTRRAYLESRRIYPSLVYACNYNSASTLKIQEKLMLNEYITY